jgi:hypothetical protein
MVEQPNEAADWLALRLARWERVPPPWDYRDVASDAFMLIRDALADGNDAIAEALGLTIEDSWVPVDESGERWVRRGRAEAMKDLREWPAGVRYADGGTADGIVHVVQERRLVGPWQEVD